MSDRILIDPAEFADQKLQLQGSVFLRDLDVRVHSGAIADTDAEIAYTLQGGKDRWQRPFLDLSVSGSLKLCCQRCLKPMDFDLDEEAHIVMFRDEAALDKAMLADENLDGIVLEPELEVFYLLEDQVLMGIPFAPTHEHCDSELSAQSGSDKPNPFAVLAGLKKAD